MIVLSANCALSTKGPSYVGQATEALCCMSHTDSTHRNDTGVFMNYPMAISCCLLAMTQTSINAFSPASDSETTRSSPAMFVQDSVISEKVRVLLMRERMGNFVHIEVNTDSTGSVYLSGMAKTQEDADKAVEVAHKVDGVTSVRTTIQIKNETN